MRVKKFLLDPPRFSPISGNQRQLAVKNPSPSLRTDFLSLSTLSRIEYDPAAHTVDRVLQATLTATGYSPDDLLGRTRTEPLVTIRVAAMFACDRAGLTCVEIDKYWGRKYGSCSHNIRLAKNLMDVDPKFAASVTLIETLMNDPEPCRPGAPTRRPSVQTLNPKGE